MKTIDLDSCKEEVEDDIEASLPVVSKDILPNTNDHKGEVCKATKAKDPTLKAETSIKEVTKKLGNQDSDDRHNDHHRRHQHHGARKPKYHERVQSKSTTTPSSQATTLQAAAGNNGVVIVKKVINEHVVEITEMLNGQMIRQSLRRFQPGERETL